MEPARVVREGGREERGGGGGGGVYLYVCVCEEGREGV